MSEYRRIYQQGGSYFFTVVTHQRLKILALPANIVRLQKGLVLTENDNKGVSPANGGLSSGQIKRSCQN
jgi:hypothetical protein